MLSFISSFTGYNNGIQLSKLLIDRTSSICLKVRLKNLTSVIFFFFFFGL